MLDCAEVLDHLFDYLDNEMEAADSSHIKAHLDLCRSCYGRLEFEQLLRQRLQAVTKKPCPDKLKKQIHKLLDNF